MCGRFAQYSELSRLISRFNIEEESVNIHRNWNVAPGQYAHILIFRNGRRRLWPMKWGLIPFWTKPSATKKFLINARKETLSERRAFSHAIKRRRCIIPADGFYEWKKNGKFKQAFYVTATDGKMLAIAGLWDCWISPDASPIETFTIITTEANATLRALHHRMPAILNNDKQVKAWLDPTIQKPSEAIDLLKSCPHGFLQIWPVSPMVNSPKNNNARCIQKYEGPEQADFLNN